jgi:NAD-dependent SIR2 family protein deacetylase
MNEERVSMSSGEEYYCPNCRAVLNDQHGFNPGNSRFCTKCGQKLNLKEYYCPNCKAILNDQYGFDPRNSIWSCTKCGQQLYGDDVNEGGAYPGVMWYCDQCGAFLNKQNGFNDSCGSWTCTECHHPNPISEDAIL